jgi:hypothetical protein
MFLETTGFCDDIQKEIVERRMEVSKGRKHGDTA